MDWHFALGDLDGKALIDPAEKAVQSHRGLSQRAIFVREVLQNALDNRADESKVTVVFRLRYLSGDDKNKFLETIKFDRLEPHIDPVRDYVLRKNSSSNIPLAFCYNPGGVSKGDSILKVFIIEDFGTRGLIGAEHDFDKGQPPDTEVPHCFMGLCRNIGQSEKGTQTGGGIHGMGKAVLWKDSRVKTVMFYSRLKIPYTEHTIDHSAKEHRCRFFGQIRLYAHDHGQQLYTGLGYFGNRVEKERVTRSLYDDETDKYASQLGLEVRNEDMCGASIVVVDYDDPDIEDSEETITNTLENMKKAAEEYFWPAIVDNRLTVQIVTGQGAESNLPMIAQPELRSDLIPFIKAYKAATGDKPEQNTVLRREEIELPPGPEKEPRGKAEYVIATRPLEAGQEYTEGSFNNQAALIRGSGMVVVYWKVPRRGLGGKNFHSVVLGGRACPVTAEGYDQERLEKLLAWAEPVTHDFWTKDTGMFKRWYGAKAQVSIIMETIKKAISEATLEQIPPTGSAAPLLARMFPFDTGDAPVSMRDISIEIVGEPFKLDTGPGGPLQYGFEIKIGVPGRQQFRRARKPSNWRVECKYGFHGEGRRRRIIDHPKSRFHRVRVNGGSWEELPTDFQESAIFERTVNVEEKIYELRGKSEPLDPAMARSTKHDIEVTVQRGYEEEES